MGQKRGYLGVSELVEAGSRKVSKEKSKAVKDTPKRRKSNIQTNVSSWEKDNLSVRKGTFWVWKTVVEIVKGKFLTVYLTAVRDSKFVWRIDNFLGASYRKFMQFWDYEDTEAAAR